MKSSKEQQICCNIMHAFDVIFNKFHASLLNKTVNFLKKYIYFQVYFPSKTWGHSVKVYWCDCGRQTLVLQDCNSICYWARAPFPSDSSQAPQFYLWVWREAARGHNACYLVIRDGWNGCERKKHPEKQSEIFKSVFYN